MALSRPHAKNLRIGRCSRPGHYYFLTASVAGRRTIFAKKKHALLMLETIRWLHTANRFGVDAAVIMPDHLHLVGQLGDSTLAKVMHTLKSFSARRLVAAGVESPVWQKGFHDHGLRDDEDYRSRVAYVLENPLRAGLVRRGEDYPYIMYPGWWSETFL
jgi:REP element-mobilizing transposase RayT